MQSQVRSNHIQQKNALDVEKEMDVINTLLLVTMADISG
jgi:hypothetical protein